ncbi:hypothetical protein C1646_773243 [Rhizophagus diaphanus]|nr:hypothetical protein C1646_773243 [Rhizophagus diaphanus] [Rhizophagus sp. MUCL 43196]
MESTHKNKKDKKAENPIIASRFKWTENAIKALFLPKKKETDCNQEKYEVNDKKETSYELLKIVNAIQRLLDQQEARQM